ncbi:MAG: hypothetical protein K2W82_09250 [Candidatus Obscuribacterales bacterium]|nr:hypothetical protein [Candidatus Obscuribacterales bacterium]
MKQHVKNFEDRLVGIFEKKAAEFSRYAEEQPKTAIVTSQLADLYRDLVVVMRR